MQGEELGPGQEESLYNVGPRVDGLGRIRGVVPKLSFEGPWPHFLPAGVASRVWSAELFRAGSVAPVSVVLGVGAS